MREGASTSVSTCSMYLHVTTSGMRPHFFTMDAAAITQAQTRLRRRHPPNTVAAQTGL